MIDLLLKINTPAASHECLLKGHGNLICAPLDYYLMRGPNSIDLATVKSLVAADPDILINNGGDTGCTPLQYFLDKPDMANMIDVVQYLVDSGPISLRMTDSNGAIPLHTACGNEGINLAIIKALFNAWPESITQQDQDGELPIHALCRNEGLDKAASLEIISFLVKSYPESVQFHDNEGNLPIHRAAIWVSAEVCKRLIDAYPESLMIECDGMLPIHLSCCFSRIGVLKYICETYPEAIYEKNVYGLLPIHYACRGCHSAEKIKFLLNEDPSLASVASDTDNPCLPLHYACAGVRDPNTAKGVKLLFDAYPDAIYIRCKCPFGNHNQWNGSKTPIEIARNTRMTTWRKATSNEVISFLKTEMSWLRKASKVDEHGWLPLHHALHGNASYGTIKLLVKDNPNALRMVDNWLSLPMGIACEFSTARIVRYLAGQYKMSLGGCDVGKNYPLHCACRGGKLDVVKYLLETSAVKTVFERNIDNKLPVQLLCGVGREKVDADSPEYIETLWLLLKAGPETVAQF